MKRTTAPHYDAIVHMTTRARPADDSPLPSGETGVDESGEVGSLLRQVAHLSDRPTPEPEVDRSGQRLAHFRIRSKLGQGGMGIVYAADDLKLRRSVALKVLPAAVVSDPDRRRRFLREARSASVVLHPNLATVFEVGEADGTIFIAMEHVEGVNLRAHLHAHGGRLPTSEALRVVREIARGVGKAHGRGVVHRDLKPENVMVAPDGSVKVLDFGLAKLAASPEAGADAMWDLEVGTHGEGEAGDDVGSRLGRVLGTPGYMSPEQASGGVVDARSDVFSVGLMLYEVLTGARPFQGSSTRELLEAIEEQAPRPLREVAPRVPGPVVRVVDRCLAKQPESRFADCGALLAALDRAQQEIASAPRAWAGRVGVGAAAVMLVGLGWWAFAASLRGSAATEPVRVTMSAWPRPLLAALEESPTAAAEVPAPPESSPMATARAAVAAPARPPAQGAKPLPPAPPAKTATPASPTPVTETMPAAGEQPKPVSSGIKVKREL